MKNNTRQVQILSSILLILLQVTIGLLGFVISGRISQYSWLINLLFLWFGVTLGIYLGGVPFFFLKSFTPRKSLLRFATTALGALIPVLLLILLGSVLSIQNEIYIALAPILAFFALVLSLLGFFIPGWFHPKTIIA